jgi:uncharacterized protein YbjT (DUF2867 family)
MAGREPVIRKKEDDMTPKNPVLLIVGATGRIGAHALRSALSHGFRVRALVQDMKKGKALPPGIEIIQGDLTQPDTLRPAVSGPDNISSSRMEPMAIRDWPRPWTMAAS